MHTRKDTLSRALEAAIDDGIANLSHRRLAASIGHSKSAVARSFGSIHSLRASVLRAWTRLWRETARRGTFTRQGIARAWAYCELWIRDLDSAPAFTDLFSGLPARDRLAPDRLARTQAARFFRSVSEELASSLESAQERGELQPSCDPALLSFELTAVLLAWPWASRAYGIEAARKHLATSAWHLLASAATPSSTALPTREIALGFLRSPPPATTSFTGFFSPVFGAPELSDAEEP